MIKRAEVYNDSILAGILERQNNGEFLFTYDDQYFTDPDTSALSLTLPKAQKQYRSKTLFPFFFGLLSEGINKQTQCRLLQIDERDLFELLLKTAGTDTIGAVTVKEIGS
jgi:HipA-like protein